MAMRRACSYDLRAQSPLHICYRNRPTCHIYHGASKDYKHISNIESHAKNSKLIMVEIYVAQSGIYARTIFKNASKKNSPQTDCQRDGARKR